MYGEDIREKHNFLPICVHLVSSFKMNDEWNEESKINNNNVLSEMLLNVTCIIIRFTLIISK